MIILRKRDNGRVLCNALYEQKDGDMFLQRLEFRDNEHYNEYFNDIRVCIEMVGAIDKSYTHTVVRGLLSILATIRNKWGVENCPPPFRDAYWGLQRVLNEDRYDYNSAMIGHVIEPTQITDLYLDRIQIPVQDLTSMN